METFSDDCPQMMILDLLLPESYKPKITKESCAELALSVAAGTPLHVPVRVSDAGQDEQQVR